MRTLSTIASLCGLILLLLAALAVRAKEDWLTIDPSYMKIMAPIVEKDADAEALLGEICVDKDIDKAEIDVTTIWHQASAELVGALG